MLSPLLRRSALLTCAVLLLTSCASTNRAGHGGPNGASSVDGRPSGAPTAAGASPAAVVPGASAHPGGRPGVAQGRPGPGGSAAGATSGTTTGSPVGTTGGTVGTVIGDHQGVTATTVKVGFIVQTGSGSYGNGAAFKSPSYGDVHKQVATIVAWINSHGGIGGRKIVPVTQDHDINKDSRTEEEGICTKFTEDDKVFAVVLSAQGYPETRRCYAKHKTLILDPSPFLYGAETFRALAPYYWSPSYVNYSRVMAALVPALKRQSYFDGSYTLGVVTYDVDVYHSIVDGDLKPALQAAGIKLDDGNIKYISNADIPTIQRGATQAVAQMQVAGVNRVIFAGLGPYAPLFMSTAEGAHFTPRYAITSYDQPRFDQNWKAMNPSSQLKGAVGIGFSPTQDVVDAQYAFPASNERSCLGIYKAVGISFAERADSGFAMAFCDSMVMLQAASRSLGAGLSVQSWAAAAGHLGTSFQAATALATSFAPGRMDGGDGYRNLHFDSGCSCFVYSGGTQRFG